ncbi:7737_t:CDS:2 [Dentiscutata erythropus]|uniref:7737_t:CDS:1 n=1 Tax=Dentiscutata erythropus TaxID=1348616 RepID=A0A9N9HFP5_9GLOM|nr:7737_t:CDS:2 [Dentiscutata erythropus]
MLGCFVLGVGTSFTFDIHNDEIKTVSHFKEAIKKNREKIFENVEPDDLRIWKVNISTREDNDKLKILRDRPHEKIDVKQELGGEELLPLWNITNCFPNELPEEHIHVIVQTPITTGKCLPLCKNKLALAQWMSLVLFHPINILQLTPLYELHVFKFVIAVPHISSRSNITDFQVNLEDSHSILVWIQNYSPTGAKPALLVESFGAQFTLCGRENTINTLWDGDVVNSYGILNRFKNYCSASPKKDRNFHPIPFLGCGPGTGKSRFLQEIHNIVREKAQSSFDDNIKSILGEAIFLNVTYGNGSAFSDFDVDIGAEASLALRILYIYFVHNHIDYLKFRDIVGQNAKQLTLSLALYTIYENKRKDVGNMEKLAIIVGIDEVNKLYDENRDVFRRLIACIGTMSCDSTIFFVPILAGTVEGPLQSVITKSMHQALQLPLQLLDTSHMLLIACNLGFDESFVYKNNLFRRIITDIGGQVRALEIFYELIWNETKTNKLEDIDLVNIMHLLEGKLHSRYDFKTFASKITPVLANAILERSVDEDDGIYMDENKKQHVSYKTLKSLGILTLEPADKIYTRFYIRLPYLWMWLLIKKAGDRSIYKFWDLMINPEEQFYWQQWEKFNINFWALRICLFSVLGYKTIKLKELLKGALHSDVDMDVDVNIPDHNLVQVHYLSRRYPSDDCVLDFDGQSCAEFDGFSFLITNCGQPILLALQMKWQDLESENPQIINDNLVNKEYSRVEDVARRIGLDKWLLLILSNCSSTFNKNLLPRRCAIVEKNNFKKFYGKIYSSRAQFSAAHDKICINSAKFFELRVIDGVGPKIAKGIIDERETSKRKFVDGEDLCKRTKFPRVSLDCIEY